MGAVALAGAVGAAASAGPLVVGPPAAGAFTLGPVGSGLGVGAPAAGVLTVFGRTAPVPFGGPAAAAFPWRGLALWGPTAARPFGGLLSPEPVLLAGLRPTAPTGTLAPVRDAVPIATVAVRTVDRAIGPSTAAFGTPSSFGTHVVLDCLSRPVGLTIPWWKRGDGPPGGSVIRDLRPRC